MKKTILKSILVALVITTSFVSCSSDPVVSNENNVASKPPPPGLPELYYRENGVLSYSTVADAYVSASNLTIYGVNGSFYAIKIPLTSLAVGTYNIGGGNKFYYNKPLVANTWYAKAGYIKINTNSAGVISGIFKVSGTGIFGVTSVNGYFNDVPTMP